MERIADRASMRRRSEESRRAGLRIGFVPTMGALHDGHLSLVEVARPGCDRVAVSIFVNPLQFGPGEDLERYPRDLDGDLARLEAAGCDLVFTPEAADMYAEDARTIVMIPELEDVLCGRSRPGHFRGVATVVAKLVNLVQPAVIVFGQKDAQQAILMHRMIEDLDFPVAMRVAPIRRDPDGLAMSSRNAYLSGEERREAPLLHAALRTIQQGLADGERRSTTLVERAREVLARGKHVRVDYVEIVDPLTLRRKGTVTGPVLVAAAVFVGSTRLIDNIVLEVRDGEVREVPLRF